MTERKSAKEPLAAADAVAFTRVAVCRKCYIHPAVVHAYLDGSLTQALQRRGAAPQGLHPEEAAVLAFLRRLDRAHSSS